MDTNENKEGYKKTKLGWIPEEWGISPFGELIEYTKGFAFKSSSYKESGSRIIRVSDTTYNSIQDDNPIFISENEANKLKKYQLKEGDIVFSTVGSRPPLYDSMVGKVIKINKKYENCLLNQNAVIIRGMKRKYVSGETHRYLGKQYRLKIIQADSHQMKLKGGYIEIHTPDNSPEIVEELLYIWYKNHAEIKFHQVLDEAMKVVMKHGIKRPEIKIKRMKRRWGSCIFNKNRIHLNLELIRTPSYCIEYVIFHELVHLKVQNHSTAYYKLLRTVIPDWQERKKKLESFSLY